MAAQVEDAPPSRGQTKVRTLINVRPLHMADPDLFVVTGLARHLGEFAINPWHLRDAD